MQNALKAFFQRIYNHLTHFGTDKSLKSIFFVILKDLNCLLRAAWLFFPPILFLLITYAAFAKLSQGQDILVSVFERRLTFFQVILTHTVWVFMTWYTSRLLSYAKEQKVPKHLPEFFFKHIPRFLGFSCYTVIILGFLHVATETIKTPPFTYTILFLLSVPYYAILNSIALKAKTPTLVQFSLTMILVFLALVTFGALRFKPWVVITELLLLQIYFVYFVVGRRKLIDSRAAQTTNRPPTLFNRILERMLSFFSIPNGERIVFIVFNIVSFVFLIFYWICFMKLEVALIVRTCSFIFLAFAFLVGVMNIISFFSVKYSISFHIIFIAMAFLTSKVESYRVKFIPKKNPSVQFSQRKDLREYFNDWVHDSARNAQLNDPNVKEYPVFFVLANGGASRSGYWVASVLSKLEDSTNGNFSKHLFCLSGASGGSLGNAAFFSLLRYKDELKAAQQSNVKASKEYLSSDFLTFTLANMLGPDYFRHLYPLPFFKSNRANALIQSMERAPLDNVFLKNKLADGFSQFAAMQGDVNYSLPVLFINTTRMQDGRPSVISNIRVTDSVFNNRVDVLSLLDSSQDMKLSTAVQLGASFPYVSPANRIDHIDISGKTSANYFVDGGYFDNSGAGVVHEMIMQLQLLLQDSVTYPFGKKFQCYVIHILNDAITTTNLDPVSPIQNDLAAPLETLAGSYGTQTSTNDLRLKKYLRLIYNNQPMHYVPINLYKPKDSLVFSMNWVISQRTLRRMDQRLIENQQLSRFLKFVETSSK